MVAECMTLLHSVVMQPTISDQWHWLPDIVGGYTVRSGYQLLTAQDTATVGTTDNLIWHKKVSLKVSILAWRLLRDRLPKKSNLLNRGVLSADAAICSVTCRQGETAAHLFLQCDYYALLWQLV